MAINFNAVLPAETSKIWLESESQKLWLRYAWLPRVLQVFYNAVIKTIRKAADMSLWSFVRSPQ